MSYFPDSLYPDAGRYAAEYMTRLSKAAQTLDQAAISAAAERLIHTARAGRIIYSCGNGGSAAIANHLVCDCLKGVRTGTDLRPKVHSFSATIELITAIVNDIGVEEMFSFQLSSMATAGDVLVAISSSGSSPNIIHALKMARDMGVFTIAMTGFTGGDARRLADISLHVDCDNYGIVEDVHQSTMHILAQYMRHSHLDAPESLGRVKF